MTNTDETPTNELDEGMREALAGMAAHRDHVDSLYAMTPDEFAVKSTKAQNQILFELVRDQAGEVRAMSDLVRALVDMVYGYERLAKENLTPEKIQEMVSGFFGMGGGMKGLFG